MEMSDIKQVMFDIERCICHVPDACRDCSKNEKRQQLSFVTCMEELLSDALALLKASDSLLGVQQTADGIMFISTGTAQQGEQRGIMLGKAFMHEWLHKELLYRDLLTDEIRLVFEQAKHI